MSHNAPLPNIMEAIEGVGYPATAEAIAARAQNNHAPKDLLSLLQRLPHRIYRNPSEVNHALGEIETMRDGDKRFWAHGASQDLEDESGAGMQAPDSFGGTKH